ncbi:hypothetical protein QEN19_002079 [Hanseniaspora menglaensis]
MTASTCCNKNCEILLWKNPIESGKILGAALLAILLIKNLKFTHIISLVYKVAFTFAVLNIVSAKAVKYQVITKYVQPSKCPNIVGFVKPKIDSFLINLPGYQLKFRTFLFAENPFYTAKISAILFVAAKLLNTLSFTTILLIAVLGAFSLPLAYNKNQKVVDEQVEKVAKLVSEKIDASPLKPYLAKFNSSYSTASAASKKTDEEPVVASESAAKTTAEDINAKIDTATSTAFEK